LLHEMAIDDHRILWYPLASYSWTTQKPSWEITPV
jgi:hypothetical protein